MTEQRGGQWSSPEKQQDEKYQNRMHEYFGPGNGAAKVRRPLEDDTAVIPPAGRPANPGENATDGAAGSPSAAPSSVPGAGGAGPGRVLLFAAALVAVVVLAFLASLLFGGGEGGEAGDDAERAPVAAGAVGGAQAPPVEDTGLAFELEDVEGDAYAIRLGEYEWEGTEAMNGDVEEVVLEGRTAAHFTTAVRLADGEIQTGVFGRAEPGKPMWHATYQRTTTGGQQTTAGTYTVVEDEEVILAGSYTDRVVEDNPEGELDRIVRDYVEGNPAAGGEDVERFRVAFDAEEGAEIPWLPGHPVAEATEETR